MTNLCDIRGFSDAVVHLEVIDCKNFVGKELKDDQFSNLKFLDVINSPQYSPDLSK